MSKNLGVDGEFNYNIKRRKGTGNIHFKICESCGYRIPDELDVQNGRLVACSEYHVRCIRCEWPVDKKLISHEGLCCKCRDIGR